MVRHAKMIIFDEPGGSIPGTDGPVGRFYELGKALTCLPEPLRQAVLLYYLDGRSTHSVAQALGISPDGVMTRLSRARRQLRERLSNNGEAL